MYTYIAEYLPAECVGDSKSAGIRSGGKCNVYNSFNLCVKSAVAVIPIACTSSRKFNKPSRLRSIN